MASTEKTHLFTSKAARDNDLIGTDCEAPTDINEDTDLAPENIVQGIIQGGNAVKDGILSGVSSFVRLQASDAVRHPVNAVAVFSLRLAEGLRNSPNYVWGSIDSEADQSTDELLAMTVDEMPGDVVSGTYAGLKAWIGRTVEGLVDLVTIPRMAAHESGFRGFAWGVGKGYTAFFCKANAGVIEGLTKTTYGAYCTPSTLYRRAVSRNSTAVEAMCGTGLDPKIAGNAPIEELENEIMDV